MKLLKVPNIVFSVFNKDIESNNKIISITPTHEEQRAVTIAIPDKILDDDSKSIVWNSLISGPIPDFSDAMRYHTKIAKLEFLSDGITLYGVTPIKMERSQIWRGRLFECTVDRYEVRNV